MLIRPFAFMLEQTAESKVFIPAREQARVLGGKLEGSGEGKVPLAVGLM